MENVCSKQRAGGSRDDPVAGTRVANKPGRGGGEEGVCGRRNHMATEYAKLVSEWDW